MLKIGIICAMSEEYTAILEKMKEVSCYNWRQCQVSSGTIHDIPVILILSGVGTVYAALATYYLIEKENVDVILVTGLAGAIFSQLQIGDIVLAEQTIAHDSWIPLYSRIQNSDSVPGAARPYYADPLLLQSFAKALQSNTFVYVDRFNNLTESKINIGMVLTGDKTISSLDQITSEILELYQAKCVDMETGAVYQAAAIFHIPCVAIRCISDQIGKSSPLDILRNMRVLCHHLADIIDKSLSVMLQEYLSLIGRT